MQNIFSNMRPVIASDMYVGVAGGRGSLFEAIPLPLFSRIYSHPPFDANRRDSPY